MYNFALINVKHHLPFFGPCDEFKQVLLESISVVLVHYFTENFRIISKFQNPILIAI